MKKLHNLNYLGHLDGLVVECLPLAQVMTLGSWGPGIESCIRLSVGSLLLPLPMSLPHLLCLS